MGDKGSHVRFKDGDKLVEYEGSSAKPLLEVKKEKSEKPLVARSASISGPIASSPSKKTAEKASTKKKKSKDAGDVKDTNAASATDKEPDSKAGVPTAESSSEKTVDETKLKFFSAFQTINRVHGGAIIKIKTGVAGVTPDKDSFPMFGSIKRWTCLHWDAEVVPASWCIAWYQETPTWFETSLQDVSTYAAAAGSSSSSALAEGNSERDKDNSVLKLPPGPRLVQSSLFPLPPEEQAIKKIRISEISDLILDASPATSFRLYCGKEVIHFTPVSSYNLLSRRSACWADALYSMMALLSEADAELVLLYKQEFMQLLQQSEDARIQQQQQQEQRQASSDSPQRSPLRRRSTLSSLLGVAAAKPLGEGDEGEGLADWRAIPADHHDPAASKQQKLTFKGAVKMLQRKLSFNNHKEKSTFRSGSGDRSDPTSQQSSFTAPGEREFSETGNTFGAGAGSGPSAATRGPPSPLQRSASASAILSPNFLSQSLFGSLLPSSSRARSRSHSPSFDAFAGNNNGGEKTVQQLQAQIDALLAHNRDLQERLRVTSGGGGGGEEEEKDEEGKSGADGVDTAAHNSREDVGALKSSKAPPVVYNSEELSTLRNFTARSNFHSNQQSLVNGKRAFSQPGLHSAAEIAALDKEAWLARHQRSPSPASRAAHVLGGKQTVLDTLLSRANAAPLGSVDAGGDDYYNDTIELDPEQVEQLVELHRLQRLHLNAEDRRDQAVNTEPEEELSHYVAPPPSMERRRRDSTTEIPLRRLSTGEVGSRLGILPHSPAISASEIHRWHESSVSPAHLPSPSSKPTAVPAASTPSAATPAPPRFGSSLGAGITHATSPLAGRSAASTVLNTSSARPVSPTSAAAIAAALLAQQQQQQRVPVNSLTRPPELPITSACMPLLIDPLRSRGPAPAPVPVQAATVGLTKQPSKRPGAEQFTTNEKQLMSSHERETKLRSMLAGGQSKPAAVGQHPYTSAVDPSSTDEEKRSDSSALNKKPVSMIAAAEASSPARVKVARVGAGVLQAVASRSTAPVGGKGPISPNKAPFSPAAPRSSANSSGNRGGSVPSPPAVAAAKSKSKSIVLTATDDEKEAPLDPLVHLSAPKWSNQYHADDLSDSTSPAARREERRRRKAKLAAMPGSSTLAEAAGNEERDRYEFARKPAAVASIPAKSMHAVAVDTPAFSLSGLAMALATNAEDIEAVSHGRRVVYDGSSGDALNSESYLALCTSDEVALIPVSDVLGAELDANCTGLFKITLEVGPEFSSSTNSSSGVSSNGSLSKILQATNRGQLSVVCKAADNAQLADLLAALMEAKYLLS